MKQDTSDMATKAAALVESHSFLATLLAMLCLLFAVNFFLAGPGSDGGSGLGGTGRFGGESGLGGTGKGPDMGPGFKLGAASDDALDEDSLAIDPVALPGVIQESLLAESPAPVLDVDSLRLAPEIFPATDRALTADINREIALLVTNVNLTEYAALESATSVQVESMDSTFLVDSIDIISSLMVAEADSRILATVDPETVVVDSTVRNRVTIPVRPERPDRFTVPARINPIQRVDVPAPPPVRPMRTLSTLLGR